MVVLVKKAITIYSAKNVQAASALSQWYELVTIADWSNFTQLRSHFPATDYVGNDRYVFNIKGNHYRLIARVLFRIRTVYIKGIFTHAEYSKLTKEQLINL